MLDQFQPDIFHMGGDEVNFNCWNGTQSIVDWMKDKGLGRNQADFVALWKHFQNKTLELVSKKEEIPVIVWTSTLTQKEYVLDAFPKDKYIIQIWSKTWDSQIRDLLNLGYKVILSNYNASYLDCGFGSWFNDGNNWCSPYIGWQKVYENTPAKIAGRKILGSSYKLYFFHTRVVLS